MNDKVMWKPKRVATILLLFLVYKFFGCTINKNWSPNPKLFVNDFENVTSEFKILFTTYMRHILVQDIAELSDSLFIIKY